MAIWGVIGTGVVVLLAIAAYKHYTTVRPKTLEELIQLLKEAKEVNDLKVSPRMSARSGTHSDVVDLIIADFTYAVCVTGQVDGKKLDYYEIVGERKNTSDVLKELKNRGEYAVRNLLYALERSRLIANETGLEAPVWTVHGPFTEIDEQALRTDAAKYGIII